LALALLTAVYTPGRARAEAVTRTFVYENDKWYPLDDAQDGPITLHRLQVTHQKGFFTKSNLIRPNNADYLSSLEIRLEYSNSATTDWKASLQIVLLDEDNREIDGYKGRQDLNEQEKHNVVTIRLSTLKYALERARKLKVSIECQPD
jgi:hypothetical protein